MTKKKNRKLSIKRSRRQGRPKRLVRKIRVRRRINVPRTAKQFFAKPKVFQDTWNEVTHVISRMRADRASLRAASREFGLDPRVVTRLAKSALRKRKNGQYVAKPTEKLLRILVIPAPDGKGGMREVATRDSRDATTVGKYSAAVQKYHQTGDSSALKKLRRKYVTDASGKRVRLLTDQAELDRLGSAGELSFESLYAEVA